MSTEQPATGKFAGQITGQFTGQFAQPAPPIDRHAAPGRVALSVRDRDRSVAFYTHTLGLSVLQENDAQVVLGSQGRALLVLVGDPQLKPWPGRGFAGLYHFALLFPTRLGLADALARLLEAGAALEGASDHGVSEAIYLRDPDGHGIELYRDRPREQWPFAEGSPAGQGGYRQVAMISEPLDLQDVLGELATQTPPWRGSQGEGADSGGNGGGIAEPGVRMGHIHLHTSTLDSARRFYGEGLGLALMQEYGGSALFMAAGGYHHHLGLNVWAGVGVSAGPETVARLLWYEMVVPHGLAEQVAHLQAAGVPVEPIAEEWAVIDPAGIRVHLVAQAA